MGRLLDLSVRELLEQCASEERTPGAGALAALSGAAAAGLVAKAARNSSEWDDSGGVAAQAILLRNRLAELAPLNDEVYDHALAELEASSRAGGVSRDHELSESLDHAAAFPLEIAEAASNVAELAAVVAEQGDPSVRGDAAAAAMLALGATRAAAHLVEINLTVLGDDERLLRATRLAADAASSSARTLAAAR